MKIDEITKDLQQSLEEMSGEYKLNIQNRSEQIIQRVEHFVVDKLAREIIELNWAKKENIQDVVYSALEERLKKVIDETWEKLKNGSYRSTTLEQYLEKKIAELIDRKINESLDKVELMVIRNDQES